MEEHSPLLHGQASPPFKRSGVDQEVHVFLIKLVHELIAGRGLWWLESFPTNMLYFVLGQVQSGCNGFIGGVLERLRSW